MIRPHNESSAEAIEISRSEWAKIRRTFEDGQNNLETLKQHVFSNAATANPENMQEMMLMAQNFARIAQTQENLKKIAEQFSPQEKGERNSHLTPNERRQIKGLYESGLYTQTQLSEQYNVSQPAISKIAKTDWKNL